MWNWASVLTLMMAPDGTHSLYMGGSFSAFNGQITDQLMRVTASGVLD